MPLAHGSHGLRGINVYMLVQASGTVICHPVPLGFGKGYSNIVAPCPTR